MDVEELLEQKRQLRADRQDDKPLTRSEVRKMIADARHDIALGNANFINSVRAAIAEVTTKSELPDALIVRIMTAVDERIAAVTTAIDEHRQTVSVELAALRSLSKAQLQATGEVIGKLLRGEMVAKNPSDNIIDLPALTMKGERRG